MARLATCAATGQEAVGRKRERSKRFWLLASGAAALTALLLPAIHPPQLRLVWNASASVPIGLYRIESDVAPSVGHLVAVRPAPALKRYMAQRHYVEAGAVLVKPVAAAAGATICRVGLRVTIDGRPAATALMRDRFGRPLPSWSGCQRLGSDQLFLIAPARPGSFDSRYFGAVHRGQIVGCATPLWTWS